MRTNAERLRARESSVRDELMGSLAGLEESIHFSPGPRVDSAWELDYVAHALEAYLRMCDNAICADEIAAEFPWLASSLDRFREKQRGSADEIRRIAREAEDITDAVALGRLVERARVVVDDTCRIQRLKENRLRRVAGIDFGGDG